MRHVLQKIFNNPKFVKVKPYLPYFIIVLAFLVFSRASPFFTNGYRETDLNTMLSTMRSLLHGKVYYRDFFEQRGLYYLWIGLPGIATGSFYLGRVWLWLLEVISWALTLHIFNKIKYHPWLNTSLLILMLMLFGWQNSGEPEELVLFVFAYAVYLGLQKTITFKQNLLLGIAFGIIIEMKYGMIGPVAGFYFGYGMCLLFRKQFKAFFKTAGIALGGVLITQIPLIIYELSVNNLGNYVKNYFFSNSGNLGHQTIITALSFAILHLGNAMMFIAAIGFMIYTGWCTINKQQKFIEISIFIFALMGASMIGHYSYHYPLDYMPVLVAMATLSYSQIKWHKLPKPFAILIACTTLGIVGFTICDAVKTSIRAFQIEQENLACKEESRIVAHNPTKVLTFFNLSNYIYTQNNGYPDMYFFERVNIMPKALPQMDSESLRYIREKKANWVAVNESLLTKQDSYSNMLNKVQVFPNEKFSYTLYMVRRYGETRYAYLNVPNSLIKNYKLVFMKPNFDAASYRDEDNVIQLWARPSYIKKYHLHEVPSNWHAVPSSKIKQP